VRRLRPLQRAVVPARSGGNRPTWARRALAGRLSRRPGRDGGQWLAPWPVVCARCLWTAPGHGGRRGDRPVIVSVAVPNACDASPVSSAGLAGGPSSGCGPGGLGTPTPAEVMALQVTASSPTAPSPHMRPAGTARRKAQCAVSGRSGSPGSVRSRVLPGIHAEIWCVTRTSDR